MSGSLPSAGDLATCNADYELYRQAQDEYEDVNGQYPESDDELINVGLLYEKSDLWTVVAGKPEVRPLPGARIPPGCGRPSVTDGFGPGSSTTQTTSVLMACEMERRTLRTANEAFNAMSHQYATSVGDLVGSLLKREPTYWTIEQGEAEPVPRPGIDLPVGCG